MDNQIFIKKDCFNKDPSTVKFNFLENGQDQSGFIVFFDKKYYAYRNKCQHLEVELDWEDNNFFEDENKLIICATHGALYEPTSGKCLMGPCEGQNLEILDLKVLEDKLIITI